MSNIADIARTYIDTPFRHQGRVPGVGLDCAGVVVCALKELGYPVEDVKGYGRIPAKGVFMSMIIKQTNPVRLEDVQLGDIIMFAFRNEPQHIAIVSNVSNLSQIRIIHAYSDVKKVTENDLDKTWLGRLVSCHRFKGL